MSVAVTRGRPAASVTDACERAGPSSILFAYAAFAAEAAGSVILVVSGRVTSALRHGP
ncbi:hypothetical protein ACGFU4_33325 [Streptomyces sp. NPDC048511]|uniref:hypothetical protein n=1 Tax=unclassified Streptomyces TaxID=2593676 RepID=UPI0036B56230